MLWPIDPSRFISEVQSPGEVNEDDALYFTFLGNDLLSISEHGIPRPVTGDEFRWLDLDVRFKHYLGRLDGKACYALTAKGTPPEGFAASGLRSWLGRVEPELFYLAGRAKQIVDFDRDHRYCGRCGSLTDEQAEDRAKRCEECGTVVYPRLSPSIIVLIRRGDEMLLARNAQWPTGMYSTLAGFVEPGESIEQTVHREVREEVGLDVANVRYLGSQSWPFPNSLMLGFHCDYHAGDIVCQEGEIAEARWFKWNELPNVPGGTAISRWLIDTFVHENGPAR